jgi:hypothetical protein
VLPFASRSSTARVAALTLLLGASAAATLAAWTVLAGAHDAGAPASARGGAADASPDAAAICAGLRCPDLIMSAPSELHFDRRTRPGHVLLRATSSIHNRGAGPLELRGHRVGARRWRVYQAMYGPARARRLFRIDAQLVYKHVPGERFKYGNVGAASYWKLKGAAAFELWSVDHRFNALMLVRRGPKVAYCLRDLFRTRPSSASPRAPAYRGCREDAGITRDVLGTSIGWADVYPYEYPEQWIDVTGLEGRFAYVQIADPGRRLIEASHDNDASETFIDLPSGRVLGRRGGVPAP